jgi:ATP synthase F1 gamma subunit
LEDFYDFHYACSLWRILSEVEASELSSRSMAMANSTKAAGEMVDELSLQYSKMRQDIATTEVIEISTGATQTLKNKAQ